MFTRIKAAAIGLSLAAALAPHSFAQNHLNEREHIRRVLLISIDGMHAVDFENCVAGGYCPSLAALGKTGINYTRTSTSRPSDSFPGLMALVSGGSPKTVGAYYDVAYDRVLAPPSLDTGNGVFAGTCTPNVANGTTTEYEEGVDVDQTKLNGGGPYSLMDGGIYSIKLERLPRDPYHGCSPVLPWNFVRTNTIFGVIHASGGYTAWSDKHPVYASVSGPSKNADNVDDYYSPEINSGVIALPGITTPTGKSCSTIRDTFQTGAWTDSFLNVQCYDTLKVNAIVNEIDGKTHNGLRKAPVPNIFGMNFQAVSVGQKLIEKQGSAKIIGGYTDAAATTTEALKDGILFVDASVGKMVSELKSRGLYDSTLIIITAKHGQSPIDPNRFKELGKGITNTPANVIASYLPPVPAPENPNTPGGIGPTEDDISLLWLADSSNTQSAVDLIEANGDAVGAGQIFYGPSLTTMFNSPATDSRTPDIIVQPYSGVIYTGSSKKQEEHGGFAQDDTNVMLLVSNPSFRPVTLTTFVETMQVAPTILKALGLDPDRLDAVRKEGTAVLPGLPLRDDR
ncbi:type I phosphodiesterase/nucleotide pyrophosphatase [Candidatus Koribacter versatilis Ellin345]|uniref:Type I phosphodiesterase/nucleotide pyrophosphatase n=1 Tax=Koribacter versatilis (strain Ellin345) TaxID=204669 RepID=Q1IN41_KORVE|nr:alkaline phosphatase family protein [Candidatus Koribacter versatilis]ABF41709.1 type I phosphodiesterase/nucleotide pyrophosphatase [Candidatus Koribacter versatilis Ellin345]